MHKVWETELTKLNENRAKRSAQARITSSAARDLARKKPRTENEASVQREELQKIKARLAAEQKRDQAASLRTHALRKALRDVTCMFRLFIFRLIPALHANRAMQLLF